MAEPKKPEPENAAEKAKDVAPAAPRAPQRIYEVLMECENCGHQIPAAFNFGTQVHRLQCPKCGCVSLMKKK